MFGQRVTNNQTITNGQTNGVIQNYYFGGAGSGFHSYAGKYPDGTPAFDPVTHFTSGNWLANFFEGEVQDYHQQTFLPQTDVYFWNVDFYGQDTWRVTPRLVLTYGLRFEHLGAWTDAHGIGAAVFDPTAINQAASATNPLPGFTWHGLNKNIPNSGTGSPSLHTEPRGGFAFDVFGTGKTVLRGGAGIYRFHDSEVDVDTAFQESRGLRSADLQGFGGNTLAGVDSVHQSPNGYGFSGGTQRSLPIFTVLGLDPNDHKDPVTNNYSLSLAQQLPGHSIIQFSYVGNNSNSLLNNGTTQAVTLNNINAIPVGYLFTAAAAAKIDAEAPGFCNPSGCTPQQAGMLSNLRNYPGQPSIEAARPYNNYASITIPRHDTYANYNAFQIVYQKQTGRLNYMLNYTFSKALGILGSAADFNFTAPIDPFNLANNYGPENFDRTQILNLSYSYQTGRLVQEHLLGAVVNNWLISGITNLQSGGNFQTGVSFSPGYYVGGQIGTGAAQYQVNNQTILGTPDVSLQPAILCNPGGGLAKNQYANGACFGLPATGTNGRAVEPYVHGPAFFNSDLTLEKGFSLGGERRLQFRYAAFNFLNHPLHSFGTGYASQTTLNLSTPTNDPTTAKYDPASGFGFAPQTIGRRLSEVSLKYQF